MNGLISYAAFEIAMVQPPVLFQRADLCAVPSCSGVGFRRVLKPLDLYLIPTRSNRYVLFSSPEAVQVLESESGDRVQQFIEWFVRHPNRFVAWIGGILHAGHGYYLRLEDRIDASVGRRRDHNSDNSFGWRRPGTAAAHSQSAG